MKKKLVSLLLLTVLALESNAQSSAVPGEESATRAIRNGILIPDSAPDRQRGEGPFDSLIIENVMLVSGEGAPPRGPVSIVIKQDRIQSISSVPPQIANARVIDASGMYALPGFIDSHTHIGNTGQGLTGPITPPEYVFKLWLAHGITTVREVGSGMGLDWTVEHRNRSEAGEITAPRIIVHAMFPGSSVTSAIEASAWVREVHRRGAEGVKLRGATPAATKAIYQTTAELGMGTSNHHDQTSVYSINVLDSARMGLDSMEHWYGLPESLFTDRTIQDYPADYNYSDEQWRFGQAGRL
ncbi:MAG: imidazolonepropionase-like amidohydrolase, partial [Glaciecola sp.]